MESNFFVFAGANGSGKSFFSDQYLKLIQVDIKSFDYDIEFNNIWKAADYLPEAEEYSAIKTSEHFDDLMKNALKTRVDFAIQTNYYNTEAAIFDLQKFKEKGFKTHLIYLYVKDIEILKSRINYRYITKNLHDVPDNQIIERYNLGIDSINKTYHMYDTFVILDNTKTIDLKLRNDVPNVVLLKEGDNIEIDFSFSKTLKIVFPSINIKP